MKKLLLFLILFTFISKQNFGKEHIQSLPKTIKNFEFIENKGQWNKEILFRATSYNTDFQIKENAFQYYFFDENAFKMQHHQEDNKEITNKNLLIHGINMNLLGAEKGADLDWQASSHYYNFFQGNNKGNWASGAKSTKEVSLKNVYSGITLNIASTETGIKYEFRCKPNSNPDKIVWEINGANKIELEYGDLSIYHTYGRMKESRPFAYQIIKGKRVQIEVEFILSGNQLKYKIPQNYNPNYELIIDPDLVFLTYSGSTADNFGCTATPGENGTLYTGGVTTGPYSVIPDGKYPTTAGAFLFSYAGGDTSEGGALKDFPCDITISKYSSDGTQLLWATYLGGSNNEVPHSIVVDKFNNLVIFGTTYSINFPVSSSAYDTSNNGRTEIIVTRFSSDGMRLAGSTYVGGSNNDGLNNNQFTAYFFADEYRGDVICDENGKILVASSSNSNNFPIAGNTIQNQLKGFQDGIIFQLDSQLQVLEFSSYLGGTGVEALYSIDISKTNEIFVSGGTGSIDMPGISNNAYRTQNLGGAVDGFIYHLNRNLSAVINATYFGTDNYDQIYSLDIDPDNQIVIVGQSLGNLPITSGIYNVPNSKQFISSLSPDLSKLNWSTNFGSGRGVIDVTINAFLVDDCGRIYLSSWGGRESSKSNAVTFGLEVTPDAFQNKTDGSDFYLMCLDKNASSLLYATFLGGDSPNEAGDHVDGGTSRFDKKGIVYQSMCASCPAQNQPGFITDLKTTPNSFSPTNKSPRCSNAGLKFDFQIKSAEISWYADTCTSLFTFTAEAKNAYSFYWKFPDGTESTEKNPALILKPEFYNKTIMLVVSPGTVCADTAYGKVSLPDSITDVRIPNVFTPNGDGKNDYFKINGLLSQCDEASVEVYNRWGQLLFEDNKTYFAWDGKDKNGMEIAEGVYFVMLKAKKKNDSGFKEYRSSLTLIRN